MSNNKHECCTPKGQLPRYVDCVGCDKKPIERMSNKKQSSIDLFAIALYEKGFLKGNGDEINDLLEEHKAMHKEEIEQAYGHGSNNGYMYAMQKNIIVSREQYYNETFGGDNE